MASKRVKVPTRHETLLLRLLLTNLPNLDRHESCITTEDVDLNSSELSCHVICSLSNHYKNETEESSSRLALAAGY
ncbi:Uncharacterized protein HZ326_16878 [Fusarium oxysporum f. sp. albedinis]|nr:Uncharacterized protein HZ326_16878 [Fusarium oxysporum f. sp. albedinis]